MPCAVVFDVNETLLELAALDSLFAEWFGRPEMRREWFAQALHFAMTLAALFFMIWKREVFVDGTGEWVGGEVGKRGSEGGDARIHESEKVRR